MSNEADYSKQALLAFADTMREKGYAKPNTALGLKVAAAKIVDDDVTDVRAVDVATAVRRYSNRHPGKLSSGSLRTYESRVGTLIREFVTFHSSPTSYSGIGRDNSDDVPKEREKPPRVERGTTSTLTDNATTAHAGHSPTRTGLTLDYPLRADFLAQVVVPRDMKSDEARRLCAFVMTLAMDFEPHIN